MSDFIVVAEARADEGKGASRRLRRLEGKITRRHLRGE